MLTFSFNGSIQGENAAEIAELFHRLVDNPKLNKILAHVELVEIALDNHDKRRTANDDLADVARAAKPEVEKVAVDLNFYTPEA